MTTQIVRLSFHLLVALGIAFSIYYHTCEIVEPEEHSRTTDPFAGPWKYLTFITAVFHLIYYGASAVHDIVERESSRTKRNAFWLFRSYLFSSAAFPLGMFVVSNFWGLYIIDRDMIFPESNEKWYPTWLNHAFHTVIAPIDVMEIFLVPLRYPTRKRGISCVSAVMASYISWVLFIACWTNFWVYPVLAVFSRIQRTVFFASCTVLTWAFYLLGEFLNVKIWGKQKSIRNTREKSH